MSSIASSKKLTVTMVDIAQRAGVSHQTVSAALGGSGRVSDRRRASIRKLAIEMGYQPNVAAQVMRARRTGRIGLIVEARRPSGALGQGAFGPLLGAFLDFCVGQGIPYHLDFCRQDAAGFQPPNHFAGGLVDGALVFGALSAPLRTWMQTHTRLPWSHVSEPEEYCVLSDEAEGARLAVNHLVDLGHRRIAMVLGPEQFLTHRLLRRGALEAAKRAGIKIGTDVTLSYGNDDSIFGAEQDGIDLRPKVHHPSKRTQQWAERIFKRRHRPTAVLCASTPHAIAVLAAASSLGLAVPRDLSLVSLGAVWENERTLPLMTAIERDFDLIVRLGYEMLQQRIQGNNPSPRSIRVPPRLVVRRSTARALT